MYIFIILFSINMLLWERNPIEIIRCIVSIYGGNIK